MTFHISTHSNKAHLHHVHLPVTGGEALSACEVCALSAAACLGYALPVSHVGCPHWHHAMGGDLVMFGVRATLRANIQLVWQTGTLENQSQKAQKGAIPINYLTQQPLLRLLRSAFNDEQEF